MKAKVISDIYASGLETETEVEIIKGMEAEGSDVFNAPIGKCFLCKTKDGRLLYVAAISLQIISEDDPADELRNHFAGLAMASFMNGLMGDRLLMEQHARAVPKEGCKTLGELVAKRAVFYADALIVELKKGQDEM